jgi:anaphase-promoting complex subunit 7
MVDCYLGLSRQREAVTVATGACKQLANSPRALTLYAQVLVKEPLSVARAKSLLERAAATGHLPAVYLLAELLDREGAGHKAVELLGRQLEQQSTARLHQLMADQLAKTGQEERAIEHYSQALALDPKNEVRTGLEGRAAAASPSTGDPAFLAPLDPNQSQNWAHTRQWGQ